MTTKQRLKIYKKSLEYFESDEKRCPGFCAYFHREHGIDIYDESYFQRIFPELYNQKPKEDYISEYTAVKHWFKPRDNAPRAECLRAAIKECEEKLKI